MADVTISDLLKQNNDNHNQKQAAPKIAGDETREKFQEKMAEIEEREKEKVTEEKAARIGLPYINLKGFPISPEALVLIDLEVCKRIKAVCFLYAGGEIRIGTMDPDNEELADIIEKLKEKYIANVGLYLISQKSFEAAIRTYERIPVLKEMPKGVSITEEDIEKYRKELKTFKDLNDKIQKVSITDIVTMIVASSLQSRASDIHIEAEEDDIKVRFRIDGVLNTVAVLKKELWPKVISRIKLLSGLKLNISDVPQDGRFTIFLKKEKTDVRVSTLPTAYGESVVMRLLRSSAASLGFDDLGIRGKAYEQLKREVERPNGMIVTTGPTGSGKTTTLYAVLNKLNDAETKIITLEDPVELKLKGINQSQIDHSRDYTFAKGLRSILRQDPDVVMVGELRDLETAETAIQAALTGHLVVSTIHTNSASGAIPRFLSMGVKSFLLAPALNAIIGQRLVRKLCQECKKEIKLDADSLEKAKKILGAIPSDSEYKVDLNSLKFYEAKGCPACNEIGYKGRIGIYEIMIMNADIEKIVLSGKVSEYEMQDIAIKNGMITMAQDGLLKALDGVTSADEVFRVAE